MLGAAVAILLWFLPLQVSGLTADAKCLSGYEWMFSTTGQSPCDVAVELASVCRPGARLNLLPLRGTDSVYNAPDASNRNDCVCSSVFYTLMSACSYCQGRNSLRWQIYKTNCIGAQLTVYNQNIPVGVKVPAYAYQDVSVSGSFNVTLAQSMEGIESTHLPQPSPSTTSRSTFSAVPAQSSSSNSTVNNTPAIIGGVVGGVVALGLIAALIIFLMLRSKQKTEKYNSSFHFNPSIIHSMSPPPGSPGRVYNPDNRSIINDPLSQNVASDITGSSAQPRAMTRASHYSGTQA